MKTRAVASLLLLGVPFAVCGGSEMSKGSKAGGLKSKGSKSKGLKSKGSKSKGSKSKGSKSKGSKSKGSKSKGSKSKGSKVSKMSGDSKMSEGSKMSKMTKGSNKKAKCLLDNSQEAAAFGSKMWGKLWYAAVMAKPKCDRQAIADVWAEYLTEDIMVWVAGSLLGVGSEFPDMPICCGIDECNMDNPLIPGTLMPTCTYFLSEGTTINCNSQNFLSFSAHNAVVDEEDCTRITVSMNEYVTYGDDAAAFQFQTGRTYGWKLTGKEEIPAKLEYIRFNCPFDLKETLVGCLDGFIEDPNYVLEDPTCFNPNPNFPGENATLCLLD